MIRKRFVKMSSDLHNIPSIMPLIKTCSVTAVLSLRCSANDKHEWNKLHTFSNALNLLFQPIEACNWPSPTGLSAALKAHALPFTLPLCIFESWIICASLRLSLWRPHRSPIDSCLKVTVIPANFSVIDSVVIFCLFPMNTCKTVISQHLIVKFACWGVVWW